jgi:uncharacterized membrane protein (UPF0127 family)
MPYSFFLGKKKLICHVERVGLFRRGLGLMFRTSKTENLLFGFSREGNKGRQLTAWFVFFPFYALWLDKNQKVVDIRHIKPWEFYIHTPKNFSSILEFPVNLRNRKLIAIFRRRIRKI